MTVLNAAVTPGYEYAFDAQGRFLVTLDRQNLQAKPTVTVTLLGKINSDGDDVADSSINAAMLADAVADALKTAVATVGDEATNTVTVSIAFKDIQGNALAQRCVFVYWLSDAENGAPTGTLPSAGVAFSKGTAIMPLAVSEVSMGATSDDGQATLVFTEAGGLTRHFNMVVQGKLTKGSQVMTWLV